MKATCKKIIIILLLLTVNVSCSQLKNENKEIEDLFYQYIKATKSDDGEEQFKFLYEEQFDEIPKNFIRELHKALKEEPLQKRDEEIYRISEIIEKGNTKYVKITFNQNLIIDLKKKNQASQYDYSDESYIKEQEEIYGKNNITFDEKNSKLTIKDSDFIFAIFHPKYNTWKILLPAVVGDGSIQSDVELIPSEILNILNKS